MIDTNSTISPLRILLVEDSEDDAIAFSRALDRGDIAVKITHLLRAEEALESIAHSPVPYDLVVADYKLPGLTGLDLCKRIISRNIPLPCIIVTGAGAEHIAVESLKAGVFDYLVKDMRQNYLQILPLLLPEIVKKYKEKQTALIFERERQAIAAISELFLAQDNDPDLICKKIPKILTRDFAFPISTVMLCAEDKEEMIVSGITGVEDLDLSGTRLPLECTTCGGTIFSGQPSLLTDIAASPDLHCFLSGSDIETCLSVPIRGKKKGVLGAITLGDTINRFDAAVHIPALQVIANHIGQEIERKQAEKNLKASEDALRKSKREWEQTFDAMQDMVTIQDKEMRIVRGNKAAYQFLQPEDGELAGKLCYELCAGRTEPCLKCPVMENLQGINNQSAIRHHEPSGKTLQVSHVDIVDDNGESQYLLHVARDITEQKEQEQRILQLSVQQEQLKSFESLKTMAGAIAHRFNNSMMVVQGNIEMITLDLPQGSEGYEMASDAMEAAQGASKIGSMMLSYLGQQSMQLRELAFSDFVLKYIITLKSLSLPSVSLTVTPAAEPLYCSVDEQMLHEALDSILTNAVESLEKNSGSIEISFGAELCTADSFPIPFQDDKTRDGMYVFCRIKDTGHGISPENIQRIFDPFYTTKFLGRGLGLPLTAGIMRQHHGAVTVASSLNTGTTVKVLLPAAISSQQTTPSSADEISKEKEPLSGNILLVDDEKIILDVCRMLLKHLGFTVYTVVNGQEAVDKIRKQDVVFCAAMLDIAMPVLDGIDAMKIIREIDPDLPIILSSGYPQNDFRLQSKEARPDFFLKKPHRLAELKECFEKILR